MSPSMAVFILFYFIIFFLSRHLNLNIYTLSWLQKKEKPTKQKTLYFDEAGSLIDNWQWKIIFVLFINFALKSI